MKRRNLLLLGGASRGDAQKPRPGHHRDVLDVGGGLDGGVGREQPRAHEGLGEGLPHAGVPALQHP